MKKIVKKYGGTYVINFTPEERAILKIKVGTIIDLEEATFINPDDDELKGGKILEKWKQEKSI